MAPEETRLLLIEAIDRLLGRIMIIPLSHNDRAAFKAQRAYWSKVDTTTLTQVIPLLDDLLATKDE